MSEHWKFRSSPRYVIALAGRIKASSLAEMSFPLRLYEAKYEVHHLLLALCLVGVPFELQSPQRRLELRPGERSEITLDAGDLAGRLGLLQVCRRASSLDQAGGEERGRGLLMLSARSTGAVVLKKGVLRNAAAAPVAEPNVGGARVLVALQLRWRDELRAIAAMLVVRKRALMHILLACWAETSIGGTLLLVVNEILRMHDFSAKTTMPMVGVRLLLHHRAARHAIACVHLTAFLMVLKLLRTHHNLAEAAMPVM